MTQIVPLADIPDYTTYTQVYRPSYSLPFFLLAKKTGQGPSQIVAVI
jgi:hypothetical protein